LLIDNEVINGGIVYVAGDCNSIRLLLCHSLVPLVRYGLAKK